MMRISLKICKKERTKFLYTYNKNPQRQGDWTETCKYMRKQDIRKERLPPRRIKSVISPLDQILIHTCRAFGIKVYGP